VGSGCASAGHLTADASGENATWFIHIEGGPSISLPPPTFRAQTTSSENGPYDDATAILLQYGIDLHCEPWCLPVQT